MGVSQEPEQVHDSKTERKAVIRLIPELHTEETKDSLSGPSGDPVQVRDQSSSKPAMTVDEAAAEAIIPETDADSSANSACNSPKVPKISLDASYKQPNKSSSDRKRLGEMTAFPFPVMTADSASTWNGRLGSKSTVAPPSVRKLYYSDPSFAPECLDVQVEMGRLFFQPKFVKSRDVSRLLNICSKDDAEESGSENFYPSGPSTVRQIDDMGYGSRVLHGLSRRRAVAPNFDGFSETFTQGAEDAPVPLIVVEEASEDRSTGRSSIEGEDVTGGGPRPERNNEWRPGDDIIPLTEPDYEAIPNFIPKFNPNEETTLKAIRYFDSRKFARFKRKYKSLFDVSSITNNFSTSSPPSDSANPAQREKRGIITRVVDADASDIIKRMQDITGRRLMIGSTEIRIEPKIERAHLLYYFMTFGEDLQIIINDLEKWTVDSYPEYKDDLLIMRWLIDIRACRNWIFSVDNVCCKECVYSWRLKRESSRIRTTHRRQTRCARIKCPHLTKVKQFFAALGVKHAKRITDVKLLVNVDNCLNPDTLASAVHTLTTTLPVLEKVEIEFQHDVSILPERVLRSRRRRSLVRSLQHLETWIGAGQRLKVTGLDNHPRLVSAWNEVKRGWYYDADQAVRFLWESRRTEASQALARRASWPSNSVTRSEDG